MTFVSTLPPVTPILAQRELSFTEFNRAIGELSARDRVLEEAVQNFTSQAGLATTASLLAATEKILGEDLVAAVVSAGALPAGILSFADLQATYGERLTAVEELTVVTDTDGLNPRSLKAVVLSNQATIAAVNAKVDAFATELEALSAITDDIDAIKAVTDSVNSRLTTAEQVLADLSDEVRNARKEFADDPNKRLVDKIDSIDGNITAAQQTVSSLVKEITDARSPDQYDTLGARIGALESSIESINEVVSLLQGRGVVTGIKVGRTIRHGMIELIPGSNIALTPERAGFRVDVVEKATCIDATAPIGDPNAACCAPGSSQIAN